MDDNRISRRGWLKGAGASVAAVAASRASLATPQQVTVAQQQPAESPAINADRDRRMQWWHAAKFGMFIHWGLYSVRGRHEWAMEDEAIPIKDYEQLAAQFKPKLNAPRDFARLARAAGQKYMVMTTKHHEGFCLFDTKLTNYCAPKQGPGRDLVKEYVQAARAEGMRVGFYYSLMDWHHPDGARCATDEAARRRFIDYIHTHIRELLTNYGKVDVLWYDVSWPLDAQGWESEKMNKMVFELQPDIIVNNRNKLPGDFQTPEQRIEASDKPWEACMTMNDSWGYQRTDDDWKSPKTIVRNLLTCTRDSGKYLLNIGPKGDGSIPQPSIEILSSVGKWMDKHGDLIHKADRCQVKRSEFALFTRQGNTLYIHAYFWPGETLALGGLQQQVLSAKMYATGQPVKFEQE